MYEYLLNIGIAFSRFLNTLVGGHPNHPLSRRIGRSIIADGWAAKIPWPAWLRKHFLDSA